MGESTIPILEIDRDWNVDEIKTVQDCNDADALLTESVASIEGQLLEDRLGGFARGLEWRMKANFALKMKKRALQQVQFRRGEINRSARRVSGGDFTQVLLNILRSEHPTEFHAAFAKARALADANSNHEEPTP